VPLGKHGLPTALLLVLIACATASAQSLPPERLTDDIEGFAARTYRVGTETMRYRLFVPEQYDAKKKYPIVIWLHGAGGEGVDGYRQLFDDQVPGSQTWTEPANQAKHPAFVLAPQSSVGWLSKPQSRRTDGLSGALTRVVAILDQVSHEFSIDQSRVYVAGQSDGGYGAWALITGLPERFAAAVILCGGGEPAKAARVTHVAIWAFHGSADPMVPVSESRDMIAAIRKAGGKPRYTEYAGLGHEIWNRAFAEPGLVDWLFAQHKS